MENTLLTTLKLNQFRWPVKATWRSQIGPSTQAHYSSTSFSRCIRFFKTGSATVWGGTFMGFGFGRSYPFGRVTALFRRSLPFWCRSGFVLLPRGYTWNAEPTTYFRSLKRPRRGGTMKSGEALQSIVFSARTQQSSQFRDPVQKSRRF